MNKLDETDYVCHKVAGLFNFLGGSFSTEKVKGMTFEEVIDTLLRNGGSVTFNIATKKYLSVHLHMKYKNK
jgi:hypothetical protein